MKTDVCVVVGVYVYHNMNFLSHWAYSEERRGEEREEERMPAHIWCENTT